jgi:hypothetical protein
MAFFVTRPCFYRSRLYFLLMSTKNIDRASTANLIHPRKCRTSLNSLRATLTWEATG